MAEHCSKGCFVVLTEQASTHSLQHGEDGEEVQRSVDASEAIRFAQTACYFFHQQRAQQHHQDQAECVVDQHNSVAKEK